MGEPRRCAPTDPTTRHARTHAPLGHEGEDGAGHAHGALHVDADDVLDGRRGQFVEELGHLHVYAHVVHQQAHPALPVQPARHLRQPRVEGVGLGAALREVMRQNLHRRPRRALRLDLPRHARQLVRGAAHDEQAHPALRQLVREGLPDARGGA